MNINYQKYFYYNIINLNRFKQYENSFIISCRYCNQFQSRKRSRQFPHINKSDIFGSLDNHRKDFNDNKKKLNLRIGKNDRYQTQENNLKNKNRVYNNQISFNYNSQNMNNITQTSNNLSNSIFSFNSNIQNKPSSNHLYNTNLNLNPSQNSGNSLNFHPYKHSNNKNNFNLNYTNEIPYKSSKDVSHNSDKFNPEELKNNIFNSNPIQQHKNDIKNDSNSFDLLGKNQNQGEVQGNTQSSSSSYDKTYSPLYNSELRRQRLESIKKRKEEQIKLQNKLDSVHPKKFEKSNIKNKFKIKPDKVYTPTIIELPLSISFRELSKLFSVKMDDMIHMLSKLKLVRPHLLERLRRSPKKLIGQRLSSILANKFKIPHVLKERENEDVYPLDELSEKAEKRPPQVCIMGHCDHGKTTLIDKIRQTSVVSTEAGSITQSIGAFIVTLSNPGKLTLFDTPGHSAFCAMRKRGASLVDAVVLVVAADEGVKAQTIESIEMAKEAGTPMVVALSKCDLASARPVEVKKQLSQYGVFTEDIGGNVPCIEISAKTGNGVHDLLDTVHLVGEMEDPLAEYDALPEAIVIESRVHEREGIVANVLVRHGILKLGQYFVTNNCWGKIRRMRDQNNKPINVAEPSVPVSITGLSDLAEIGTNLLVVESEKKAKQICSYRLEQKQREKDRQQTLQQKKDPFEQKSEVKEILFLLKCDVMGSLEAVKQFIESLIIPNQEIKVKFLNGTLGDISKSDIKLAWSTKADAILGFGVDIIESVAKDARSLGVNILKHSVIFHLMDDVIKMIEDKLEEKYNDEVIGTARVQKIFKNIAGCQVVNGTIHSSPGYGVRVKRKCSNDQKILGNTDFNGSKVVYEQSMTPIESLRRHKDSVAEIGKGYECGINLGKEFNTTVSQQIGDVIECIKRVKIERSVSSPFLASTFHKKATQEKV